MKSRKNVAKISKIRAWKDQNAYIISYEKTWHEDVVYAPTLYKYCAKYGIPMKNIQISKECQKYQTYIYHQTSSVSYK